MHCLLTITFNYSLKLLLKRPALTNFLLVWFMGLHSEPYQNCILGKYFTVSFEIMQLY